MIQLELAVGTISWMTISFQKPTMPVKSFLEQREATQRAVLRDLFLGRDVWIITAEPQTWSITDEFFLTPMRKLRSNGVLVQVGFAPSMDFDLIEEVVACPDFELSTLWVAHLPFDEDCRGVKLIASILGRGMNLPFTTEEVVLSEKDGNELYLMNSKTAAFLFTVERVCGKWGTVKTMLTAQRGPSPRNVVGSFWSFLEAMSYDSRHLGLGGRFEGKRLRLVLLP